MITIVKRLTPAEIEARRASLLTEVGMTEEELRERGAAWALTETQAALLDELDDLEFLMRR